MKTLYIIRHAKSDWNIISLKDIDRPLNTRGYKDAQAMSNSLKAKNQIPELIITSPAIRAISTALIFARNFDIDAGELRVKSHLYHTNTTEYLNTVHQMANEYSSVMLFGHNPIVTDFANSLTKPFSGDMPTCGIVCIQFQCNDWKEIGPIKGELVFFDSPKK